jgi:hypothetical protein
VEYEVVHADGDSMIEVREMKALDMYLPRQIFRLLPRTLRMKIDLISTVWL